MKEITFDEALDISLSERQIKLASGVPLERNYQRRELEQNLMEVFELVGGVPRLAIWANNPKNYGAFLKLLAKLLPKELPEDIAKQIIYQSSVPHSALNDHSKKMKPVEVAEDGQIVEEDGDSPPSEQ